jgi:hypothetical protein
MSIVIFLALLKTGTSEKIRVKPFSGSHLKGLNPSANCLEILEIWIYANTNKTAKR